MASTSTTEAHQQMSLRVALNELIVIATAVTVFTLGVSYQISNGTGFVHLMRHLATLPTLAALGVSIWMRFHHSSSAVSRAANRLLLLVFPIGQLVMLTVAGLSSLGMLFRGFGLLWAWRLWLLISMCLVVTKGLGILAASAAEILSVAPETVDVAVVAQKIIMPGLETATRVARDVFQWIDARRAANARFAGAAASTPDATAASPAPPAYPATTPTPAPTASTSGRWVCATCTLVNESGDACAACGSRAPPVRAVPVAGAPVAAAAAASPARGDDETRECRACTFQNENWRTRCAMCSTSLNA